MGTAITEIATERSYLTFYQNPQHDNRKNGSLFMARYAKQDGDPRDNGNFIVFPNPELDKRIFEEKLSDSVIAVDLELRHNANKGTAFYVAHIPADRLLVTNESGLSIQTPPSIVLDSFDQTTCPAELQSAVIAIDGQNLLHTLKNIREERNKTQPEKIFRLWRRSYWPTPLEVITNITRRFQSLNIGFFICRDAAIEQGLLTEDEMVAIERETSIETVLKQRKIIPRAPISVTVADGSTTVFTEKLKVDVDPLVVGWATRQYFLKLHCQCLVLVSGDSDFEDLASLWAGVGQYQEQGQRYVVIVSARGSMSRELYELTQLPHIEYIDLKEVVDQLIIEHK